MNIFYLDTNPKKSARMQCDKHCVKMILESAQMLSTAHRVLDGDEYADKMGLYKLAHKNHPSTVWVRSSSDNYRWLWKHYDALMQEYTLRYGKTHATSRLRNALLKLPANIPNDENTSQTVQLQRIVTIIRVTKQALLGGSIHKHHNGGS